MSAVCDESHLAQPKFGFVQARDVLSAEFIIVDILDADWVG